MDLPFFQVEVNFIHKYNYETRDTAGGMNGVAWRQISDTLFQQIRNSKDMRKSGQEAGALDDLKDDIEKVMVAHVKYRGKDYILKFSYIIFFFEITYGLKKPAKNRVYRPILLEIVQFISTLMNSIENSLFFFEDFLKFFQQPVYEIFSSILFVSYKPECTE